MSKHFNIISGMMRGYRIVFFMVAVLVVMGTFGLLKMNKDEYPQFTIRQGVVVGVYPGASPIEVEEQLTKPLENFLFTFPEVDKQKTYSYSEEGVVYVFVELNKSIHNKNESWSRIRHGLKDFKMMLPSGVLALLVMDDFGNTVSMLITVESADKTPRELEGYVDALSDRLRGIPAMGNIRMMGDVSEEISVFVEQEKLSAYGVSAKTLMMNLFAQGFTTVGGSVRIDDFRQPLRVVSPYGSEREVAEQIVYSDAAGNVVRLRDVARVERRYVDGGYIKKDGERALVISVEMRPGNDIVAFGDEVKAVMTAYQATLPPSVKVSYVTDQSKVVGDSVWSFLSDLVLSILVVIVVMLMLFPLESALVAGSGIPICIAVSLAIMYVTGIELNTVSLAALIMVLGMMVDNSIVVIDAYFEKIGKGMSRWHAAVSSAKEMFSPLLLATAAICLMFFPVERILTGPFKDFMKVFPWTITISLFVSLLYAVCVVPFLEFAYVKPRSPHKRPNMVARAQNVFFGWLQGGYEWVLGKCFRHSWLTLTVGVGSMVVGVLIFVTRNIEMMPVAERNSFAVEVHLPIGSSIESTQAVSDSLESMLLADDRVTSVTAFVGITPPRFHATYAPKMPGEYLSQIIVNTESNEATESLVRDYGRYYAHYFPNATVRFKQLDYQGVATPIEVRLSGAEQAVLEEYTDKLIHYMRSHDDTFAFVHSDSPGDMPFVEIHLKHDEATRLGVTKTQLTMHLAGVFGMQPLTTLWEGDYAVPVRLYLERDDDELDYETIGNTLVPTAMPSVWVPLRQVADVAPSWQPVRVVHRNGINSVAVGCDMQYGVPYTQGLRKVKAYVQEELEPTLPKGVKVSYGGTTLSDKELIPELVLGVIAALLVMLTFLLLNFAKLNIAFLSLASCGLCLFGSFFGIWAFGLNFGITSVLGLVSLIGITVRNAIIMFEYAEYLRVEQRWSAYDAAYEAGKRRMRPIFLTSATTALGVLPMIISSSTLWMPMGICICFGTVFSILLVVTVLPVTYWKIYKN